MEVQGHRGDRSVSIENTLPAFNEAVMAGADAIEMDLQATMDREIVVHHDFAIKGKHVPICRMTLDEIKKGNPLIPTLDEVFLFLKNHPHPHARNIRLNLEIKRDPKQPELCIELHKFIEIILAKVEKNGFAKRIYYSSFDPESLTELRRQNSHAELGFIFDEASFDQIQKYFREEPLDAVLKLARALQIGVVSPKYSLLSDPTCLQRLKAGDLRVIAWTINDPKDWAKCIQLGIDGIITDHPRDLIRFLNRKISG